MALSEFGFLFGMSIVVMLIITWSFGIRFYYIAKKYNAKMLIYASFALIFFGLSWLAELCDFLTILITDKNIDNSLGYLGAIGWVWMPFTFLMGILLAIELFELKRKRSIKITYIVVGIIFELFVIFDLKNAIIYDNPSYSGERIIYFNFADDHPLYYIFLFYFISIVFLCVIRGIIKGIKTKGIIRRKYFLFSLSYLLIKTFGTLTAILPPSEFLIVINYSIMGTFVFVYFALKEDPIKREKFKIDKMIEVEGGLFRLSKRPDNITEEEVAISKEKKICLVCKGKVLRYSFICAHCEAFYCNTCAAAIMDLENICWACESPLDETKPVKIAKSTQKEIRIDEKTVNKQ